MLTSNLQEQHDKNREKYLSGEMTHHMFYLWLAKSIGLNAGQFPTFMIPLIKASKDEHLNDVPLAMWDRCDSWVNSQAGRHGMKSWSLCSTVCCLKAVARHEIQGKE